ncbi:hypothetical protein K0504_01090 [Neiella marina]|uniref:NdvB protein n=1 Tax=Neiella holothuriorum TaxID=2870530 RepID=A0ABS7EBI4_9GAMM|nr:amylo-alpha-1,6-glucosidase [Neiella holothuriorum]MBW8189615.1 hypothetical protein [Neiella holothuriorum]
MTSSKPPILSFANDGSCSLFSPTAMPAASSFLWNSRMMAQYNCRGYVTAQFMQPEPAKYSKGPGLEATTFMQPEQPYFSHYPGRFFYIQERATNTLFSAPYEPCRVAQAEFEMRSASNSIQWRVKHQGIEALITTWLGDDEVAEYWSCQLINHSQQQKSLTLTPYFSVGYLSWMNQQGYFDRTLNSIVCPAVTPYQKVEQYFANHHFADTTFLWASTPPDSWQASQQGFEGEGGLHRPSALEQDALPCEAAIYQTPVAALQYQLTLAAGETSEPLLLVFGAAKNTQEIHKRASNWRTTFLELINGDLSPAITKMQAHQFKTDLPDQWLQRQVNHWLHRQVTYHGETNRLTTDPQTRNYLQDALGMCFIEPTRVRQSIITALSQQHQSGEMPDGILLHPDAELKYINQVPHTDHCVWLPMLLETYLQETNDFELLQLQLPYADSEQADTVQSHISKAMDWLKHKTDKRGLSLIEQGDWCDPMNMVGYKGSGVSAWLTIASAYACQLWGNILKQAGESAPTTHYQELAAEFRHSFNHHCWDQDWYLRGISDDGIAFGTAADQQGRIFLNPQSFALLANAPNEQQIEQIRRSVRHHLNTPFGLQMLAPAFTQMHEHIGRVTQKFPGSAENGSVYNHAAAFYIYALYQSGFGDEAYQYLTRLFPSDCPDDQLRRGQLPVFVPNYYRGAHEYHPEHSGRSSQLFNTGSAAWVYRIIIQCLFGFVGDQQGIKLTPQLPSHWQRCSLTRSFRGATVTVNYCRDAAVSQTQIHCPHAKVDGQHISGLQDGQHYDITVTLPT